MARASAAAAACRRLRPKLIAKAVKKAKQAELSEQCTYPLGITYPKWPEFDSSVKFNETDPAYVDGHVRALAWRKVWQAIKEHFEAARDEYAHSLYNSIMKIRISTLDKPEAEERAIFFMMLPTVMAIRSSILSIRTRLVRSTPSSSAQLMPIEFTAWWCTPSPSSST